LQDNREIGINPLRSLWSHEPGGIEEGIIYASPY
jgi:hypothetical protein